MGGSNVCEIGGIDGRLSRMNEHEPRVGRSIELTALSLQFGGIVFLFDGF